MKTGTEVLLNTYRTPLDAHLMHATLGSHNIESNIRDEHLITMHHWYANVLGGVKLYVASDDYDKARAIMLSIESQDASEKNPKRQSFLQRMVQIIGGIFGLLLFGLPLTRFKESSDYEAIEND